MAQITALMKAAHGQVPHMVPAEVREQIDDAELLDRLVYAEQLLKKAADQPGMAEKYRQEARAVLTAPPRDEAFETVWKAQRRARMFQDHGMPGQAEQAARHAYDLSGRYRQAPERTWSLHFGRRPGDAAAQAELRKGAQPVFDHAGHLLGVAHPGDIKAAGSGGTPVFDESGARRGSVEPARITRV